MGQSELCWTANVFVFLLLLPGILGWGREGHYAVCKIAEGYLTEDALSMVRELLPASAEGDLAAVCSWADELRENHDYHWSSVLHFVDTPDFFCNYNCSRDCHDSHRHKGRCVTAAIYNYTMQLESAYKEITSEVRYNLTEALMFLSHFIGDVHQPLHVGFVGDLGGNLIKVGWYQRSTNLHHVWDTMIIESALKRFYHSNLMLMIQAIQSNISDEWHNEVSAWRNCTGNHTACPNPYASESISLACKYAYKNATPGSTLEDSYFLTRLPVVEKRLAQSGIRLASTLNRIFASEVKVAEV